MSDCRWFIYLNCSPFRWNLNRKAHKLSLKSRPMFWQNLSADSMFLNRIERGGKACKLWFFQTWHGIKIVLYITKCCADITIPIAQQHCKVCWKKNYFLVVVGFWGCLAVFWGSPKNWKQPLDPGHESLQEHIELLFLLYWKKDWKQLVMHQWAQG